MNRGRQGWTMAWAAAATLLLFISIGWPDGTQTVRVSVAVHLRGGKTEQDDLHWPFVYRNAEANPFSPSHSESERVPFQFPPSRRWNCPCVSRSNVDIFRLLMAYSA